MMDRKFHSGSSLDQALMKASRDLGISKEEIKYRQIEKKHGFLKMRRSIVIEVDPKGLAEASGDSSVSNDVGASGDAAIVSDAEVTSERTQEVELEISAPSPPAPEQAAEVPAKMPDLPAGERPVAAKHAEATGEIADAIREALKMLLELVGADMESSVVVADERYEVELRGPDQELILRDNGRPLLSIQHLLVRLVRGQTGEGVFCRVDCDQFHEIREERLRDLAQRVASDVASGQRSQLLESMAPDERRIVHMTLANDPSVETESQGNGYFKRVKILPL